MFWLEKCVLGAVEPDTEGPVLVLYPAHPQFSIGIVWIGGMVVSTTLSTLDIFDSASF